VVGVTARVDIHVRNTGDHIETTAIQFDWSDVGATDAGDVVSPIHLTTTHGMHSPGDADHGYKYTPLREPHA